MKKNKKKGYITPYALLILIYVSIVCINLLILVKDEKLFFNENQNVIRADYESLGDFEEININFLLGIEEAIEKSNNEDEFNNCFKNLSSIPRNIKLKKYYNIFGENQRFDYIKGGSEKKYFVNEGKYLNSVINVTWQKNKVRRNFSVYIKIKNPFVENKKINKDLIDEEKLYSVEKIILN